MRLFIDVIVFLAFYVILCALDHFFLHLSFNNFLMVDGLLIASMVVQNVRGFREGSSRFFNEIKKLSVNYKEN